MPTVVGDIVNAVINELSQVPGESAEGAAIVRARRTANEEQ